MSDARDKLPAPEYSFDAWIDKRVSVVISLGLGLGSGESAKVDGCLYAVDDRGIFVLDGEDRLFVPWRGIAWIQLWEEATA